MTRAAAGLARATVAFVTLALLLPASARAQFLEPPPPAAYALRNVTLVEASGERTEGVTVVVRDALIEAIGPDVAVPADARVLDGDSLVVYPGLIDAQGIVGYAFPEHEIDRDDVLSWDPPRVLQGFTPHLRVFDYLTADGASVAELRGKGIVATAVLPSSGLIPGQGAFLLLRKDAVRPAGLVVDPAIGVSMSFSGSRGVYPGTLFGAIAFLDQALLDAGRRALIVRAVNSDPRGIEPPGYDPDYAVLQDVLAGEKRVFFFASDASDIRRALRLAAEHGFEMTIVGGQEAWEVADQLRATETPVLVSLDFPEPEQWEPEEEGEQEEPLEPGALREKEELEEIYANAGRLADASVRFALTSGEGKADLLDGARQSIEYGLDADAALRALTETPAALFGAPILARIEEDLPATFIVTDGPLFGEDTEVRYTFVEGRLEEAESDGGGADAGEGSGALNGEWDVTVTAGGESIEAEMTIVQTGDEFTGSMETDEMGTITITNGTIVGDRITFEGSASVEGQTFEMSFTGTVSDDSASGTASGPFGTISWTATRRPGATS